MRILRNLMAVATVFILQIGLEASSVNYTRDPQFGIPIITGGNLEEVSRTVGRLHAEDRLWQIFLQNIAANGRLAEFLGAGAGDEFVTSDTFQRQINPTDAEVEKEIRKYFTENTLTAFKNYVKGLNDYVDEVNANPGLIPAEFYLTDILPVPHFTLFDNLRSVRFFFQSFSSTQIPFYQLDNVVALKILAATYGNTAAYAILEDVDPTTSQVRSLYTLVPNNNPTPKMLESKMDKEINLPDDSFIQSIQAISNKIKSIKALHKKFAPGLGSDGQVIGPKLSRSDNPILRGAPQPNFNHPSDFYQVIVKDSFFSGNYFIVPGIPFGIGMYNRFGFTAQTGHLPTNDFLFESPDNISSSRQER